MKEAVIEELHTLCEKILQQNDSSSLRRLKSEVGVLYQKLAVMSLLEEEEKEMENLFSRVADEVYEKTQEQRERTGHPQDTAKDTPPPPPESSEYRVLPHPEGPPTKRSGEKGQDTREKTVAANREEGLGEKETKEKAPGQIKLGLNDRISLTRELFSGSQEDFNRVMSQLATFQSFKEAEDFLREMVKPEYDWEGKEEYEERLVELVKAAYGQR